MERRKHCGGIGFAGSSNIADGRGKKQKSSPSGAPHPARPKSIRHGEFGGRVQSAAAPQLVASTRPDGCAIHKTAEQSTCHGYKK